MMFAWIEKIINQIRKKWGVIQVLRKKNKTYADSYFLSRKKDEKQYYIFRFAKPNFSLFAAANKMLLSYEWAIKNEYIPIVDIEYLWIYENNEWGKENIWEYCFEQPCSVKEAVKEKYVLAGSIGASPVLKTTCKYINSNPDDKFVHAVMDNYQEYYARLNDISAKIWKFKPEVKKLIDIELENIFLAGRKILGVSLREEFSRDLNKLSEEERKVYSNHPNSMGIEDICLLLESYLREWECTHIFVSTIYQDSLELLQERFGEKILYIERERRILDKMTTSWNKLKSMDNEAYYKFLENNNTLAKEKETILSYTKEIVALSRCDCLIGAKSSGTISACVMNGGKYEHLYIIKDERNINRY